MTAPRATPLATVVWPFLAALCVLFLWNWRGILLLAAVAYVGWRCHQWGRRRQAAVMLRRAGGLR